MSEAVPKASRIRLAPPLSAAVALLLVLGIVLARPGGSRAADATEHVVVTTSVGPIAAGERVVQRFTAGDASLTSIAVRPSPSGDCTLTARLLDGDEVLASGEEACASIRPGRLVDVIDGGPVAVDAGSDYDLELGVEGDGAVAFSAGPDDAGRLPPAQVSTGSADEAVSLEIHTDYAGGDSAAVELGTALDRLTQGRPWWQQSVPLVLTAAAALSALVALTVVRGRLAVGVLVVFVVAKGLVWTAILPPFQSPDEPAHFAYAQFLVEELELPERDTDTLDDPLLYSPQVHRLADLVHMNAAAEGDRPDYEADAEAALASLGALSRESASPEGNGAAAGYPPGYYLPTAALYAIGPDRVDHAVQFARWSSIGFGVALALAALVAGRRLFGPSSGAALALAVAVSAQPMISQQMATVNNDAMVIAAGAWAFALGLELSRPVGDRWPLLAFWASFAVGASLLAKNFGLAMAPVVFVGWLIGRLRTERSERPPLWREALLAGAGLAVTYGIWAVIAAASGFQAAALADFEEEAVTLSLADYLSTLKLGDFALVRMNLVDQLWGNFGWLRAPLPVGVQHVIGWALAATVLIAVAALVRAAALAVRDRRREDAVDVDGLAALVLAGGAVAGTLVLLYTVQFRIFQESGGLYILQGRYFLIGIPALLALPAVALNTLVPRVSHVAPAVVVAGSMVVLNIVSVAVVVEHFYL